VCNWLHTAQALASDESPSSKLHFSLVSAGTIYTFDSSRFLAHPLNPVFVSFEPMATFLQTSSDN